MRTFFKNSFYFLSFCAIVSVLFITIYVLIFKITFNDIPALNFSDSYSFNEKIRFLKSKQKDVNVIALGSSATLNNINSKSLLLNMEIDNFLNTSSWGMSMGDDFYFLKSLNTIYKVERLLIVSNNVDFQNPEKKIDFQFVESYLKSDYCSIFLKFLSRFNLQYYINNFKYAKKVRSCYREYEYLNYDKYGTVNFVFDDFNINNKRWLTDYWENSPLESQYNYLDSIINYCNAKDISLMFFQSPARQGVYEKFTQSKLDKLNLHIEKVKKLIEKDNHIFINSYDKIWPDSLFVDAIHFNEKGAILFTEYCFTEIKARKHNTGYKKLPVQ